MNNEFAALPVGHENGLAAIAGADARTLILGSFPGIASLQVQRYYAHPRNAFWPIMAAALGIEKDADYRARCQSLIAHQIALWDVVQSCNRAGSLDSAIELKTLRCNDFKNFFSNRPSIQRILFNGQAARQFFNRFASPTLPEMGELQLLTMPSTSPANAAMQIETKSAIWCRALQGRS